MRASRERGSSSSFKIRSLRDKWHSVRRRVALVHVRRIASRQKINSFDERSYDTPRRSAWPIATPLTKVGYAAADLRASCDSARARTAALIIGNACSRARTLAPPQNVDKKLFPASGLIEQPHCSARSLWRIACGPPRRLGLLDISFRGNMKYSRIEHRSGGAVSPVGDEFRPLHS